MIRTPLLLLAGNVLFPLFTLLGFAAQAQAGPGEGDTAPPVGVIELRNYVIKPGMRDSFLRYFEAHFIGSQRAEKGYVLGQYRVKGAADHFFWIRGFTNMRERSAFLPAFYYGPVWKAHKSVANSLLVNNDNVHLLRPLLLRGDSLEPATAVPAAALVPTRGIGVVEFYTANTRLPQLLKLYSEEYAPLRAACGVPPETYWTSVLEENDFPRLPVFQDKNLLVTVTFYASEAAYAATLKRLAAEMPADLKARLQDVVTLKNTLILYPSTKTLHPKP